MNNCYVSGECPHYLSGDSKPPNHHVRVTVPCRTFLEGCQMDVDIRLFFGETVACEIDKIRKIKKAGKKK